MRCVGICVVSTLLTACAPVPAAQTQAISTRGYPPVDPCFLPNFAVYFSADGNTLSADATATVSAARARTLLCTEEVRLIARGYAETASLGAARARVVAQAYAVNGLVSKSSEILGCTTHDTSRPRVEVDLFYPNQQAEIPPQSSRC